MKKKIVYFLCKIKLYGLAVKISPSLAWFAVIKKSQEAAPQNNISVAYLCDQQAQCKGGAFCGNLCTHTTDIKHAKNFKKIDETHYMETSKQRGTRHNGKR